MARPLCAACREVFLPGASLVRHRHCIRALKVLGFGLNTEADARIRTADPFITSEVLYQLSYVGATRGV